jgi:hypothetical protein
MSAEGGVGIGTESGEIEFCETVARFARSAWAEVTMTRAVIAIKAKLLRIKIRLMAGVRRTRMTSGLFNVTVEMAYSLFLRLSAVVKTSVFVWCPYYSGMLP